MQFLREDNRTSIAEIARNVNELQRQLELIDPVVSGRAGMVEPPASMKRVGKMAFADGVNWNPLGIGVPCQVMWDGTQWVPVPGALAPWGRKNYFINGNCDIWQRGTGPFGNGGYAGDRWYIGASGSTLSTTRQPLSVGAFAGTSFCQYHQLTSVNAATSYALVLQRIEGVRSLSGKKVTVSFLAAGDVPRSMAVSYDQIFGTGGSPSAAVLGPGKKLAITASWAKYSVTLDIPSIAGKTLGTNGDDFLQILIWFDAGSNYDTRSGSLGIQGNGVVILSQLQIEEGPVATAFEQLPIGETLALCQRYYEPMVRSIWGGYVVNGSPYYLTVPYKVPKRKSPPTIGLAITATGSFPAIAPALNYSDYNVMEVYMNANATSASGYYIFSATIDAEF